MERCGLGTHSQTQIETTDCKEGTGEGVKRDFFLRMESEIERGKLRGERGGTIYERKEWEEPVFVIRIQSLGRGVVH